MIQRSRPLVFLYIFIFLSLTALTVSLPVEEHESANNNVKLTKRTWGGWYPGKYTAQWLSNLPFKRGGSNSNTNTNSGTSGTAVASNSNDAVSLGGGGSVGQQETTTTQKPAIPAESLVPIQAAPAEPLTTTTPVDVRPPIFLPTMITTTTTPAPTSLPAPIVPSFTYTVDENSVPDSLSGSASTELTFTLVAGSTDASIPGTRITSTNAYKNPIVCATIQGTTPSADIAFTMALEGTTKGDYVSFQIVNNVISRSAHKTYEPVALPDIEGVGSSSSTFRRYCMEVDGNRVTWLVDDTAVSSEIIEGGSWAVGSKLTIGYWGLSSDVLAGERSVVTVKNIEIVGTSF